MSDRPGNPLLAWHASPYDLPEGRFGELRKVSGSGQGQAVFGRGVAYAAESPKVSGPGESEYMKEFANHPAVGRGEELFGVPLKKWVDGFVRSDLHSAARARARREFNDKIREVLPQYSADEQTGRDAAEKILTSIRFFPTSPYGFIEHHLSTHTSDAESTKLASQIVLDHTGPGQRGQDGPYSYRVAMHVGPETLLDWDAKMQDHHPEARDKIAAAFEGGVHGQDPTRYGPMSGESQYRLLTQNHGSDFNATEALLRAGIHGIRYKDAGSRNHLRVTYNGTLVDHKDMQGNAVYDRKIPAPARKLATFLYNVGFGRPNMTFEDAARHGVSYDKLGMKDVIEWAQNEMAAGRLTVGQAKPTYNYVIFHPDFINALEQYDIKGRRVKAYAPKGIKLKAVDHDPFEGEGK